MPKSKNRKDHKKKVANRQRAKDIEKKAMGKILQKRVQAYHDYLAAQKQAAKDAYSDIEGTSMSQQLTAASTKFQQDEN